MTYQINDKDIQILRSLAMRQAEIAAMPEQKQKADLWKRHNDLKTSEPVVFIDPEIGWREIITEQSLECSGELARSWERDLRKNIYWAENLKDDKVIDDFWPVPQVYRDTGWGLDPVFTGKEIGKAYHIDGVLKDYEENFEKLRYPEVIFDDVASEHLMSEACHVFDGILKPFSYDMYWWSLGLTWAFIELRGFEDFLCDFMEEPEWLKKTMDFLCEGTLRKIKYLESAGKLRSNVGNRYVGSGGFGFTDDLPSQAYPGEPTKLMNMWGFVESQETVSVSPRMYGEFIFPSHLKIAQHFGLNCYGCCEPFEDRWDYVKTIPNLRRISVSPWSNRDRAMDILGNRYVASHKLNPNVLSQKNMDENEARRQIRHALDVSKSGCPELIMKDNTTLGNNPNNAIRWVEIVREEIGHV